MPHLDVYAHVSLVWHHLLKYLPSNTGKPPHVDDDMMDRMRTILSFCILEPVDTAAALASGSAPRPPLPQPWASALPLLLGSGPNPFEATHQPSEGRPETEGLRTNPLTGILGQLLSMSLASGPSGPSDSAYSVYRSGMGWAAFLWALITWILYEGFPLGFIPCLRDFSQLSSSVSEDTNGIPYDRVTELKLYEIEEYECPAARRGDLIRVRARA